MFNVDKYYLGKLCPQKHEYQNTGKSLRYKVQWKCVQCMRDHVSVWVNNNPEKKKTMDQQYAKTVAGKRSHNAANQRYQQNHQYDLSYKLRNRRNQHNRRVAGNMPTQKELDDLFDEQGHMCLYCLDPLTYETYTIEHILPISRGGTNNLDNIGFVCQPCNSSRRNKSFVEWTGRNTGES